MHCWLDKFNNKSDYYFNYNQKTKNIDLFIDHIDLIKYESLFKKIILISNYIKMMIIHWFD